MEYLQQHISAYICVAVTTTLQIWYAAQNHAVCIIQFQETSHLIHACTHSRFMPNANFIGHYKHHIVTYRIWTMICCGISEHMPRLHIYQGYECKCVHVFQPLDDPFTTRKACNSKFFLFVHIYFYRWYFSPVYSTGYTADHQCYFCASSRPFSVICNMLKEKCRRSMNSEKYGEINHINSPITDDIIILNESKAELYAYVDRKPEWN